MGSFETLCQTIAIDPAMLVYLDNATNRVGAEQENFGRELMRRIVVPVSCALTGVQPLRSHGMRGSM